jgi:hypothetical protein
MPARLAALAARRTACPASLSAALTRACTSRLLTPSAGQQQHALATPMPAKALLGACLLRAGAGMDDTGRGTFPRVPRLVEWWGGVLCLIGATCRAVSHAGQPRSRRGVNLPLRCCGDGSYDAVRATQGSDEASHRKGGMPMRPSTDGRGGCEWQAPKCC